MSPRRGPGWACLLLALAACGPPEVDGPDWTEPPMPTPAPARMPLALHVDGAALKDATGAEVRLRGLNVCSLEFDAEGANWQLQPDGGSLTLDVLGDPNRWKANVVRVPVNQEWFLTDDAYAARLETVIDAAALRGLYVLLDVQWERGQRTEPYQLNILKQPTFGFGNTTEAFWHRAAGRWANRTHLLFDLINEPHDTPPAEVAASMQRLVDRLRQRAPDAVVIIGGPDWAHSVGYYRDNPIRGSNLAYAAHQYLPYDVPAKFFENFERTAELAPVLLAEFSAEPAMVEGGDYAEVLLNRAEAAGVDGWLPWAIGCGISLDDDRGPLGALAGRMRQLNP